MSSRARHEVSRYFDSNAESWRRRYYASDFDSTSYQDRMLEAFRLLAQHAGERLRVLDLGCGAGVQAEALQSRGHEVFACDLAHEMAAQAGQRIGGRAAVAVGERLPFADASFDAVVSLGVIGYAADRQAFLESLWRVVRPGGLVVISMANNRLLLDRWSTAVSRGPVRLYRWGKQRLTGQPLQFQQQAPSFYTSNYRYLDARAFDAELAAAGFQRLGGGGVNFGRLRFMGKPLTTERLAVAISRGLTRLSRRLPNLDRQARIYVTAVRKPAGVGPAAVVHELPSAADARGQAKEKVAG